MQITFYDKNMFETAVADNALMNAIKIKKASLTSLFEEATHQVEFEFSKEFGEWWGIKENGYLAFRFKGDFFRFSIVKFKEDAKTNTITIVGDYFNLEMLNENCIAYEKQPARTIVQHLTAMEILPYANFEIGVNELANSTRVLTYTGDEVKYKRLISAINNFGGECEFEIKQKANGQFDKLILNIYKANDGVNYQGVGRNRRDLEITIDNSNNVSRMVDSTEIKTSIEPIGKDGLRLGNRGTTWKNEDGQVEFYQKNNRIYAPLAADEMQRVLDSDKFLLWKQSIDTDNVAKLEAEGLKWLKNVCYAKEIIEVSGSFDVEVGDTVILNHKGIGQYGILGSLRVMKVTWDLLDETSEVTFANFKRLASKISAQGLALQESIETPASYDIQFNTTGGTVFKNNTGSSNVSFNFSKNGVQTAVLGTRWYKGTQLLSNGLEVMIKPDKLVDDKLVLRLEVDVTDSITYSKELTFINVNDGVKGDQGNGITSTENYYLVSPNKTGITSITTGWVKGTPQVPTPINKYHWHYRVDNYSDSTKKETVPAIIGVYGDKGPAGALDEKQLQDINDKIDSKADLALTQAQLLALEERTSLARENAIAEAMQNTISEVEARYKLWYETTTKDEKQKVASDIASLFDRTVELNQKLGAAIAKFDFINNETLIGEEGIAIGDKEGKAKLFMSQDSISFVTNGTAQMTLTGDTLMIKNGLFTDRIQIGKYVEEVYDANPNFNVIRYIG